jgi:hypothetical protein
MAQLQVVMSGSTLLPSAVTTTFGTFSDPDFQRILTFTNGTQQALLQSMFGPGPTYTNTQLLKAWIQAWINASINQEQALNTPPPQRQPAPPPVVIGP